MRMPEPHLQTLGTHPLGIVAPKWASLGLPFQRQCFDFHRLFSAGSAPRNHLGSFPQLQDRFISILQIIRPCQGPPMLLTEASAAVLAFQSWTPRGAP